MTTTSSIKRQTHILTAETSKPGPTISSKDLAGILDAFSKDHGDTVAMQVLFRMLILMTKRNGLNGIDYEDELGTMKIEITEIPKHLLN
jgi:hypothetical protein